MRYPARLHGAGNNRNCCQACSSPEVADDQKGVMNSSCCFESFEVFRFICVFHPEVLGNGSRAVLSTSIVCA